MSVFFLCKNAKYIEKALAINFGEVFYRQAEIVVMNLNLKGAKSVKELHVLYCSDIYWS